MKIGVQLGRLELELDQLEVVLADWDMEVAGLVHRSGALEPLGASRVMARLWKSAETHAGARELLKMLEDKERWRGQVERRKTKARAVTRTKPGMSER